MSSAKLTNAPRGLVTWYKKSPKMVQTQAENFLPWYFRNHFRKLSLPYEQKIRGPRDGVAFNPRFITIKPTFRCNLRCSFCRYVANGQVFGKADYFLDDEWFDLIDEVAPAKPYISITGGEPLLYPRIGELLQHCKDRGLHVHMVTNGTLLERKAEELMKAPPASLQISVDGRGEKHDALRMVSGTFEKVVKGLKKLNEVKAEMNTHQPLVAINSVISGENYRNMPEMVEVAQELGADLLNFQHFWFTTESMLDDHNNQWGDCFYMDKEETGFTETTGIDTAELWKIMTDIEETSPMMTTFYPKLDQTELDTYYNRPTEAIRPRIPGCAWLQTAIFPNGDVSPCFNHVVGNIREQSFEEIWNGEKFRAHRMRLSEHGGYSMCARCCAYFRYD